MKYLLIALLFLLPFKAAFAQKDSLSFDERNKYIFYHVVSQPGLTPDTFRNRSLYFLKTLYPKNKVSLNTNTTISGTGKFLVLSGITVAKHLDGEIDYTFHIEYKDEKYRYWLTDFVFTPYKIDRYGNSVPQEGLDIALEDGAKKLDRGQFNTCMDQTGIYCRQFGSKVKQYMVHISASPIKDDKKKVISTKSW